MKTAAKIAVARDNAVLAPRAPNTVPDAPAPKPAPASAPLPRWTSTRAVIATAQNTSMIISNECSIFSSTVWCPEACLGVPATRRGATDGQELLSLERRAPDQAAVDVRHRE